MEDTARVGRASGVSGVGVSRSAIVGRRGLAQTTGSLRAPQAASVWISRYLTLAVAVNLACAALAGVAAYEVRYHARIDPPDVYMVLTACLPLLWWGTVALSGGYDSRIVGSGADFHRILRAGVSLTAAVAIFSYAAKVDLARGYVVLALPSLTALDMLARYGLRKRLHRQRRLGICTRRTVLVGPARTVTEMITALGRDSSHGLHIVAACVPGGRRRLTDIAGVPVGGGVDSVTTTVHRFRADTVAVVNCAQMDQRPPPRARLGAGDDRHGPVSPPHCSTWPGLAPPSGRWRGPLRHLDHANLSRADLKAVFDRTLAASTLLLLSPLLVVIACVIHFSDGGPVLLPRPDRSGRPPLHRVRVPRRGSKH